MATTRFSIAFIFAFFVASFGTSTCLDQILKASVSCLDCDGHRFDYSGIEVAVKCDKVRKPSIVRTESDGSFSVKLPSAVSTSSTAYQRCIAMIRGGPSQLYVSRSSKVSQVIITSSNLNEKKIYTMSTPLVFYTKPPSSFGSSKTIDIPLPPEWGLAPSSYYVPFFPIIGVP